MNNPLARKVRARAGGCCEYCQLPQFASSIPFEIDHIIAQKHHGATVEENLALACFYCNSAKGPNIAGLDTLGNTVVRLFHPRRDEWTKHFRWNGETLIALSAVGRVTIDVLCINAPDSTLLRASLIREGVFPPRIG